MSSIPKLKVIVPIVWLAFCGPSVASEWFVRPTVGQNGSKAGTSYLNAWDGFSGIQWQLIEPGDRLFICGTHDTGLAIKKDGTASKPIVIDGSCPSDPGMIYPRKLITGQWEESTSIASGVYKIDLDSDPHVLIVDDMVVGKLNHNQSLANASSDGWRWLAAESDATGKNYNDIEVSFWDGVEALWGYDAKGIKDKAHPIYLRFRNRDNPNQLKVYRDSTPYAIRTNAQSYVTIQNLAYKNSRYGIYIDRSSNITVDNVTSVGNNYGVSLNSTQGNIVISNSSHTGVYYGMQDRVYYPHFAYNQNQADLDRGIQTASWACLWMKSRFPSQMFNQAGIALFGENSGPLDISGNWIKNVQRGIAIDPSLKNERQLLTIFGNTIDRAIRTALSIGWGWDAKVEDNIFRNNNISLRVQEIDQPNNNGQQPGREIAFRRNRVYNNYDAGYAFFFHYSQAKGGSDTGVNEDIDLSITNNTFLGGGGTYFGKNRCTCFMPIGTNLVFKPLSVNSSLEYNRIDWNTSDGDFDHSYPDREWLSIDNNMVLNHTDDNLPMAEWIGKNNRILTNQKTMRFLNRICLGDIQPKEWCDVFDFEETWTPPGIKSENGEPDFNQNSIALEMAGQRCLALTPKQRVTLSFTPVAEIYVYLLIRQNAGSGQKEKFLELRCERDTVYRYAWAGVNADSMKFSVSDMFGNKSLTSRTYPDGLTHIIRFHAKIGANADNNEAHLSVWNGKMWEDGIKVNNNLRIDTPKIDNLHIQNADDSNTIYLDN